MSTRVLTLDGATAIDLLRLVEASQYPRVLDYEFVDVDVLGAIEVACAAEEWARVRHPVMSIVDSLTDRFETLEDARAALANRATRVVPDHSSPESEVRRVPRREEFEADTGWWLFLQRFNRGLRQRCRMSPKIANGITAAASEFVDNVIQYAFVGSGDSRAAVGYRFRGGFQLVVGDLGVGVLSSLRTNPQWIGLNCSEDALIAVVRDRATARQAFAQGNGIDTVLRSVADLGADVRLRSGESTLVINGVGARATLPIRTSRCTHMSGTIASIWCPRA